MGGAFSACGCGDHRAKDSETVILEDKQHMTKVHRTIDPDFISRTSTMRRDEEHTAAPTVVDYQNIKVVSFRNDAFGVSNSGHSHFFCLHFDCHIVYNSSGNRTYTCHIMKDEKEKAFHGCPMKLAKNFRTLERYHIKKKQYNF